MTTRRGPGQPGAGNLHLLMNKRSNSRLRKARAGWGIMMGMMSLNLATPEPDPHSSGAYLADDPDEAGHPVLRALSLASLLIGVTALGLYLGRELRQRYKFKRRTPYDLYSNAGDPVALSEYGMGV